VKTPLRTSRIKCSLPHVIFLILPFEFLISSVMLLLMVRVTAPVLCVPKNQ